MRTARPISWTLSTYFAEGLPWSVLHQISGELLTALGVPAAQVGYTSWLHATSSLKFLWSPIVEWAGSLRGWMIATQLAMATLVAALAAWSHGVSPSGGLDAPGLGGLGGLWLLLVLLGVASATHDVACDGYYIDALPSGDQARLSGVRVAAFRLAMLFGGSWLVWVAGEYGFATALAGASVTLALLALGHALRLPRPANAAAARAPTHSAKPTAHTRASWRRFLTQPRVVHVIGFLVTYKLADGLMFSMSKVLLARELGLDTAARGVINTFSIGTSIAGALLGGAWIGRRGLERTLVPITVAMAITEPLYVGLAHFAPMLLELGVMPRAGVVTGVVVIEQLFGGMATAAQMVLIMRRVDPRHSAAHYAYATALYATSQMVFTGYSGHWYEQLGPVGYFWLVSAATLPALWFALRVPKGPRTPSPSHTPPATP